MDARKQPSVGLCIAFVALLPVIYCLSLGPMTWVCEQTEPYTTEWFKKSFEVYFAPGQFVYEISPEPVQKVITAYIGFFTGDD